MQLQGASAGCICRAIVRAARTIWSWSQAGWFTRAGPPRTPADEQGVELPSRRLGHRQGRRTGHIDEADFLYRPENERDYGAEAIEIQLQVIENNRDDLVVTFAG